MSDIQKWLRRAPGVLTFFMVIALGVTLANLLWLVLTPPPEVAEAGNLKTSGPNTNTIKTENYGKLIADQHIFGAIPRTKPKAVKTAPAPAPKKVAKPAVKNLNLKLHGIIASKSGNGGFAMISYNGKTQEVYRQGEPIPKIEKDKEGNDKSRELDGVTVKAVEESRVVIDNNGTEQIIELAEATQKASKASSKRTASRTARPKATRPQPAPTNNGTFDATDNSQIQTLADLRDQALNDPSVVMTVITPSIVRKDGVVTGIRVYPSRNRKMFRELGFKNGDIITKVNDIIIDDKDKGLEVFQQISEATSLSITVIRGGNEQVLNPQF